MQLQNASFGCSNRPTAAVTRTGGGRRTGMGREREGGKSEENKEERKSCCCVTTFSPPALCVCVTFLSAVFFKNILL